MTPAGTRQLNIISWNGQSPKYDLRDWDPHHERMSRGITLHPGEMRKLVDLYFASNNRKTVEEGQNQELKKRERQAEFRKAYVEKKQETTIEAVEKDALEGALPPEEESAEDSLDAASRIESEPSAPLTEYQTGKRQETSLAESF